MTLDEAIKRYTDNAEYERTHGNLQGCLEFRQLAEWLTELKDYRERIPSYEAGYNDAKREIALSGEYERAYERGKQDVEQTRWIPVSERLPNHDEYMKNNGLFNVSDGTISYSEWFDINEKKMFGELTMNGFRVDRAVTAWMPLPEPYGGERDE